MCVAGNELTLLCFGCQRPEKMNEKPSVLPAVEVIAPGGSYNPDFFDHQVTPPVSCLVIGFTFLFL